MQIIQGLEPMTPVTYARFFRKISPEARDLTNVHMG